MENLFPHAGIQDTSKSFHKQADKLPHESRQSLGPPTKMSVREHLRMHCSRKALWKAAKRPMSINLMVTIVKIKVNLFSLRSSKIRMYCYKVSSIIHDKNTFTVFYLNYIYDTVIFTLFAIQGRSE